jgi:enoyl-CoA hydratase
MCEALAREFGALAHGPAQAIVLTGRGRAFSAGVDLIRLSEGGAAYVRAFLPALHAAFDAVLNCPKPVVAAINGHAIAGGCVLACCADRRLMVREGAKIGVTEMRVGVPFPALAFEVMRLAVVPRYFNEVMLGAATYAAEDARERGLVDDVVDEGELTERARSAADRMAELSPPAFALTKRQRHAGIARSLAEDGKAIDAEIEAIWTEPASLARIHRYIAETFKRP